MYLKCRHSLDDIFGTSPLLLSNQTPYIVLFGAKVVQTEISGSTAICLGRGGWKDSEGFFAKVFEGERKT